MKPYIWSLVVMLVAAVQAQNLVPNGGFELGADPPTGWRADGNGSTNIGNDSERAAAVMGNGRTSSVWRSEPISISPGGLYRFAFDVKRSPGTSGGTAMAGISRVNRDFSPTEEWNRQSFIFTAPHDIPRDYARIGQWNMNGRLFFDNIEMLPVQALHLKTSSGADLGEGESIRGGVYGFSTHLGWSGANFNRTLVTNRASFNSDRWMFSPGAEVIYRMGVAGARQQSATLQVNVNYHVSGGLVVEVSRDGLPWQPLGAPINGQRSSGKLELPAGLFPTEFINIRLRAAGDANFQANQVSYAAPLIDTPADLEGETRLIALTQQDPRRVVVRVNSITLTNGNDWAIQLGISNRALGTLELHGWAGFDAPPTKLPLIASLRHGITNLTLRAPSQDASSGTLRIRLSLRDGSILFGAETDLNLYFLSDPRPGYWLSDNGRFSLWWCESGWKIGRNRPPPERPVGVPPERVSITLARGEYEPAQVVLTPRQDGELLAARVEPLQGSGSTGQVNVAIHEVAYVHIAHPTDRTGGRGAHPDPLPLLKAPLRLRAGVNHPLWLTFRAATNAAAGEHAGELVLETTWGVVRVPLRALVYDFAMPEDTHLRSAFGMGVRGINRYHNLSTQTDKELVYEKYLRNFAEHRISPYSFYEYSPIDVRFRGEGTNKQAQLDFTRFDAAAEKWLGPGGFSTFQLRLRGMGGGTFESRALGRLEGFEEGTPEHARLFRDYLGQIEGHLRNKGWLDKAFVYWFDEPEPKDYEFVIAGMKRLKAAAPGLKRMLTEQPEAALIGHVDIWCGLTPEWTVEKVRQRRAAGETVWWYICTAPKAPYVTEFIDHPGVEMRLWPWQSWQYGVEGILVWETTYWNSTAAFPGPQVQDPWQDPMSYVSGYSFKPGHIGFWGNGDGRFLYPPRRDPNSATAFEPALDDPVTSIRWENLRDGMEDYEYFWLLENEVRRLRGHASARELISRAESLLTVPPQISADLVNFATDPRPILLHRDRMARMIEQLKHR